jgi:soluble lytic murein transglycosylase-like protein
MNIRIKYKNKNTYKAYIAFTIVSLLIMVIVFNLIKPKPTTTVQTYTQISAVKLLTENKFTAEPPEPEIEIPAYNIPLSKELQQYTYEISQQYDIAYELVLAVMWKESRMNIYATYKNSNKTTDNGIMQLNSRYAKSWAISYNLQDFNVFNAKNNIFIGVRVLADRISYFANKKYSDELLFHAAISSYNKGIGGYMDYKSHYGFKSDYSKSVLKYKEDLEITGTFSNYIDKVTK